MIEVPYKESQYNIAVNLPVKVRKQILKGDIAKWWAFLWFKLVELWTKENGMVPKTVIQTVLGLIACYVSVIFIVMCYYWAFVPKNFYP